MNHDRRTVLGGLAACTALLLARPVRAFAAMSALDLGLEAQNLLTLGDRASAVANLSRALEMDPENDWLWGLMGRARLALGQRTEALAAFRRAARLNPADTYSRMMAQVVAQKPATPVAGGAPPAEPEMTPLQHRARQEEKAFSARRTKTSASKGYQVRRIVLDPGHGGFDPGAVGPGGLREKDVALDIARRAAGVLERSGGLHVHLTRDGDYFVPLSARTALANRFAADLFVSVHANAATRTGANGLETYSCSERASSAEAERMAAFENAVLSFEKDAGAKRYVDVEDILFRFERRRYYDAGARAAGRMQQQMLAALPFADRGVHAANFFVLRKARMPAVLLETGFISNPADEKLLARADKRADVADAVAQGVLSLAGKGA